MRSILRRKSEVLILKNLYISAAEYDYHTLLKVAEMAGLAGIVGFHEAGDGYLVSFPAMTGRRAVPACPGAEAASAWAPGTVSTGASARRRV